MTTLFEEGPQTATDVKAHWFSPLLDNTSDGTLIIDPYTDNYNSGTSPWDVTLTTTLISNSGTVSSAPVPIAAYQTGYNFHIEDVTLNTNGDTAIFYDTADSQDPSTGVDIDVQAVDADGNPIAGTAKTLVSDVEGVQQFRVGAAATGGATYDLTYASVKAGVETVYSQVYTADGTAVPGQSGTIDSFNVTNGESYGFTTLIPSSQANPTYIYTRGSGLGLGGNNLGVKYELVGADGAATTSLNTIEPFYPAGSTSQRLSTFVDTRLDSNSSDGADFVVVQRYSYVDSSGVQQEALDVRTINAVSQGVSADVIIPVEVGSSGLTITRVASGGFIVGYGDGPDNPSVLQEFDANGNEVGGPFSLPSNETQFNLDALPGGRVLIEYPAGATGENQLDYDIYDTQQPTPPATVTNLAGDSMPSDVVGSSGDDVFYLGGGAGPDTISGGGGTDFLVTSELAGSGPVLVDLRDGQVDKGPQVDAYIGGILGVTLGSDPSVVLGLSSGTDLIYGGSGDNQYFNEGATDYIQGGAATNEIVGGSGTSIFYGNGGSDVMLGGSGQNFMKAGPTAASTDIFYGNGGTDFVYGGPGATDLVGGSGTEDLTGESGYNQLVGSNQSASALNILNGGSGTDLFYAGIGTNLLFEAAGTDLLAGNAGTDIIYGGSGRSFIYGGSGTDVVTTGAGNQYVQAGSGSTFFNDTAANLTAGRFDQIDNFAGGQGTNLYLPTADQGATSFVSQNGGTAVLTSVGGGTAEIFASGTDVATVQSHTHFTL